LSKANVVRFGRRAAADHARLRRDEFSVLLVAQANGFRRNATAPDDCRYGGRRLGTAEGYMDFQKISENQEVAFFYPISIALTCDAATEVG
jgi:hypothetical protein